MEIVFIILMDMKDIWLGFPKMKFFLLSSKLEFFTMLISTDEATNNSLFFRLMMITS
jgi:hypothetical protein